MYADRRLVIVSLGFQNVALSELKLTFNAR
jgi:hypothetical protein